MLAHFVELETVSETFGGSVDEHIAMFREAVYLQRDFLRLVCQVVAILVGCMHEVLLIIFTPHNERHRIDVHLLKITAPCILTTVVFNGIRAEGPHFMFRTYSQGYIFQWYLFYNFAVFCIFTVEFHGSKSQNDVAAKSRIRVVGINTVLWCMLQGL